MKTPWFNFAYLQDAFGGEPRIKAHVGSPKKIEWAMGNYRCLAVTKSEARAEFKKMLGHKRRLPVGAKIISVISLSLPKKSA